MQIIGDRRQIAVTKRIAFGLNAEPQDADRDARREDEMNPRIALVKIPHAQPAALDVAVADVSFLGVKLERERRFRFDQRHVLRFLVRSRIGLDLDRERIAPDEGKAERDNAGDDSHG